MKKLPDNMKTIRTFILAASVMLGCAAYAQNGTLKKQDMKENKKMLVVFFSRAGENYAVGNIAKGNTHIVAEIIAEETGADLFRIEPVTPYPEDYNKCTDVAKQELNSHARPAIKGDIKTEDYDVIFIGYPNWWGDMPMPVYTFIEKHDWQGKTVRPFCTHEGSGIGSTGKKLEATCKGATVQKGLAIRGATAQHSQEETQAAVKKWL